MSYGEVLSSAWKIIWKHKILWVFGILAGLGSGSSSGWNGDSGNGTGDGPDLFDAFGPGVQENVNAWLMQNWWVIAVLVIVGLLLFIGLVVLGTYGRIGLARGAWKADDGALKLTFSGLFAESGAYFVRVFLLQLLVFGLSLVMGVAIGVPVVFLSVITLGIGLICLLPLLCILAIVAWFAQLIVQYAVVAIVGEELGTLDGLKRGWELARAHMGETFVMGLILMLGGGLAGGLIALPLFLALVPLSVMFAVQSEQVVRTGVLLAAGLACLYLPLALFLSGVLQAYLGAAWALTFRRLSGRGPAAPEVIL